MFQRRRPTSRSNIPRGTLPVKTIANHMITTRMLSRFTKYSTMICGISMMMRKNVVSLERPSSG